MAKLPNSLVASNGNSPKISTRADFPMPLGESIVVELETGRVVEMVVGELAMLYELGEIPDDLTALAARELFPPAKELDAERERRWRDRLKVARWLVSKVLRNPRVVDEPKAANEISIGGFYISEIWEVYGLANDPALAMSNFRRQQARHVAALSGLQNLLPTAEPADESAAAGE